MTDVLGFLKQVLEYLFVKQAGIIVPFDLKVSDNPQPVLPKPLWGKVSQLAVKVKDMGGASKVCLGDADSRPLELTNVNSYAIWEAPHNGYLDMRDVFISSDVPAQVSSQNQWKNVTTLNILQDATSLPNSLEIADEGDETSIFYCDTAAIQTNISAPCASNDQAWAQINFFSQNNNYINISLVDSQSGQVFLESAALSNDGWQSISVGGYNSPPSGSFKVKIEYSNYSNTWPSFIALDDFQMGTMQTGPYNFNDGSFQIDDSGNPQWSVTITGKEEAPFPVSQPGGYRYRSYKYCTPNSGDSWMGILYFDWPQITFSPISLKAGQQVNMRLSARDLSGAGVIEFGFRDENNHILQQVSNSITGNGYGNYTDYSMSYIPQYDVVAYPMITYLTPNNPIYIQNGSVQIGTPEMEDNPNKPTVTVWGSEY